MNNSLNKIFNKNKNIIIGVIHFPPLFGYKDFPGYDVALKNSLEDLKAFQDGGVDGIIIENNYDIPHKVFVETGTVDLITQLGKEIKKQSKVPIGVNILWNDYKSALSISKNIESEFIRIPVFVDKVKTDCGDIAGDAEDVLAYQKEIGTENVALFTDIQVKHSELLEKKLIEESAIQAINSGSDGLIITGKWTGQAPDLGELERVRKIVGNFPILTGSGADKDNIEEILKYANGVIVSTSLKMGETKEGEVNVKSWQQRIDVEKVKDLVNVIK
jgi:hypothetical protein